MLLVTVSDAAPVVRIMPVWSQLPELVPPP